MCNSCKNSGNIGLPAQGKCSNCGCVIGSMTYKLCARCAITTNCCRKCGKAMSGGGNVSPTSTGTPDIAPAPDDSGK